MFNRRPPIPDPDAELWRIPVLFNQAIGTDPTHETYREVAQVWVNSYPSHNAVFVGANNVPFTAQQARELAAAILAAVEVAETSPTRTFTDPAA